MATFHPCEAHLFAAATPAPVVARLQDAVRQALARPEIAAELTNQGTEPAFLPAENFRAFINSEQQRWAEVVKVSGVKLE